jgi:hypothetical protein
VGLNPTGRAIHVQVLAQAKMTSRLPTIYVSIVGPWLFAVNLGFSAAQIVISFGAAAAKAHKPAGILRIGE